jgi:uncharacterized protein
VIFVDSNIPMYLVGAPHPRKTETQILLERAAASKERLVTDAEVLQEILHRYTLIERRSAIQTAFEAILEVVDDILPVEKRDVLRAGEIVQLPGDWNARAALHIAIMERHGIRSIMSFDADFDRWPGLSRVFQF